MIPSTPDELAAKYQAAITTAGDTQRGLAHYRARCFVCHRAAGEGAAVGPDLITVKAKGREALLTAILDLHKEVAPQYIAFDVTTKGGDVYTGLIPRDDASSLTIKIMGGAEVTLARADVKGTTSSGRSLMPEGLATGLSATDLADLLTFIEQLQ